eukprot:6980726-Lingulodinium_polyedra.AAC.1
MGKRQRIEQERMEQGRIERERMKHQRMECERLAQQRPPCPCNCTANTAAPSSAACARSA